MQNGFVEVVEGDVEGVVSGVVVADEGLGAAVAAEFDGRSRGRVVAGS